MWDLHTVDTAGPLPEEVLCFLHPVHLCHVLSHLECKYVSRDTKYECVVLVKKVWHKQKLEALPDLTVQMVEDLISRLQSSVSVKCLVSCGDVEKNPGPGR